MLDIKFVRENPDAVKENIKKKFQDAKLPLVDEVIEKDAQYRAALKEVEALKAARNKLSKANGPLFGQLKKCDDEAKKAELQAQIDANNAAVKADADKMAELEAEEAKLAERIQEIMYTIPQMIDPSVPIGPAPYVPCVHPRCHRGHPDGQAARGPRHLRGDPPPPVVHQGHLRLPRQSAHPHRRRCGRPH